MKKQNGITLIALVITIIVLLILAGIVINVISGEGGIISNAQNAKNKAKQEQIKEKVELALHNYLIEKNINSEINFKEYMKQQLNVETEEKTNGIYWFILDGFEIELNNLKIIKIEEIGANIAKSYQNIDEMKKDSTIQENTIVKTNSYLQAEYGGGAYYSIVKNTNITEDNYRTILLENGLYAQLYPINNTVTPNQFGAYGDGIHDDREALQRTFDSDYTNIKFETNQKYKICDGIELKTSNVNILGEKSSIITANDYTGKGEFLFRIYADNVNIKDLKMEATETQKMGYGSQFVIFKANNIDVENCSFIVPNKLPIEKGYTNIDLYSDWHNVTINNCELTMLSDTEEGGCIWIRDIQDLTANDLKFTNNVCTKKSHDEILAVFRGYIENIDISNNKFYVSEGDASSSVMNFTLGASSSKKIENLTFANNEIVTKSTGGCIWMTNLKNANIDDNTINYTVSKETGASLHIFRTTNTENVVFERNNVTINSDETTNSPKIYVAPGFTKCLDNTFESNCKIEDFIGGAYAKGNSITINAGCSNVFNAIKTAIENNIYANSQIGNCFQLYNLTLQSDVLVKNNVLDCNFEQTSRVIYSAITETTMGEYTILFEENTIKQTIPLKDKLLLNIKLKDVETKTVTYRNNNIGNFKNVYQHNKENPVNIIMEGNI